MTSRPASACIQSRRLGQQASRHCAATSFNAAPPPDSKGHDADSISIHPLAGSSAIGASPTGTLFHQRSRAKLTEPNSQSPSACRRGSRRSDTGRAPVSNPAT